MSTSNLKVLADRLQRSIQRTLQGAKPRHQARRLRQLLAQPGGLITILTPIERDGKRTVRVESITGSRLAVAGYAVERAREAALTDEARKQAGLKDRGAVTGRHKILAKVLCWLVLVVGFTLTQGCGGIEEAPPVDLNAPWVGCINVCDDGGCRYEVRTCKTHDPIACPGAWLCSDAEVPR